MLPANTHQGIQQLKKSGAAAASPATAPRYVQKSIADWFSLLLVIDGLAVAVGDCHIQYFVLLRELDVPAFVGLEDQLSRFA